MLGGARDIAFTTLQRLQERSPLILASLPLVLWFRDSVGSLCTVRGASMEPTLQDGDVVWLRKADIPFLTRLWSNTRQESGVVVYEHPPAMAPGNIVVFLDPEEDGTKKSIKRVTSLALPWHSIRVQGDALMQSRDSRHYGLVSKHLVLGVAEVVVWPPWRWQTTLEKSEFSSVEEPFTKPSSQGQTPHRS